MNQKVRALVIVMACIFLPAKPDQSLDCRKLVYSRNCRGVALKRGYPGSGDAQSGVVLDGVSLNGLLNSLYSASEPQVVEEGLSSSKMIPLHEERSENGLIKDKVRVDALPRIFLFGNRLKNGKNDNPVIYEY